MIDLISERLAGQGLKLDHAEQLLSKMREAAKQGDMVTFYDFDLQFHQALWHLADNEYLAQLLEQVVAPLFAFFVMLNLHPDGRSALFLEAVSYHERVVQALKSHSPEKARRALQQLLGLSLRQQQAILNDEQARRRVHSDRSKAQQRKSRVGHPDRAAKKASET